MRRYLEIDAHFVRSRVRYKCVTPAVLDGPTLTSPVSSPTGRRYQKHEARPHSIAYPIALVSRRAETDHIGGLLS